MSQSTNYALYGNTKKSKHDTTAIHRQQMQDSGIYRRITPDDPDFERIAAEVMASSNKNRDTVRTCPMCGCQLLRGQCPACGWCDN